MTYVQFVLLTKPAGWCRPAAVAGSLCVLRANVRLDHVRTWATRIAGPFLALGAGECIADVAARVLLRGEAISPPRSRDGLVVVYSIADIEKCFDRVEWRRIVQAVPAGDWRGGVVCSDPVWAS
eukprot:5374417-Pyramimonas_sp.AAC.1